MKTVAGALGAAAFLFAVFVGALGDFHRTVLGLRDRLDLSEDHLVRARAEVERLRTESASGIERARTEFDQRMRRAGSRDMEELQRDMMAPSVQVSARGSVGGGTLLFSRENHTYVISAWHVVQKIAIGDDETREAVEVTIYDARGVPADSVEADLVAWDEKKDLALLRLRTAREFPATARLAARETLQAIRVFTPIYAVGCPLGHDPLPTPGEIATLNKEVNGEKFWMMSAPTIFGNSGGGIFHRDTRELIGVSVMVCTYEGAVSTPVPHLGILVSLEAVYDWLDSLNYQFVYDPEYPIDSFAPAAATKGTEKTAFPPPR